jgi:hypothetical protein
MSLIFIGFSDMEHAEAFVATVKERFSLRGVALKRQARPAKHAVVLDRKTACCIH